MANFRDRVGALLVLGLMVGSVVLAASCQAVVQAGSPSGVSSKNRSDALYQVSLLNGLMQGDYDGTVSIGTLKQVGDLGLGTFDTLDGELVMLDGVVYQAKADGTVQVKADDATVPFAAVTFYDAELTGGTLQDVADLTSLKQALDAAITGQGGDFNQFYAVKISGDFAMAHVRSVPAQSKPYQPLAAIAKTQPEFSYENLAGTIIGFRCPDYVEGINLPGWHLHFLSADKAKGGHLLDAQITQAQAGIDRISDFQLRLPRTAMFAALNLASDLKTDTKQVESK